MLSIFLLYSLTSPSTVPLPTLAFNSTSTDSFPVASTITRSVWDIVRSCLTVIFACTWVALHPNISAPIETTDKGRLQKCWRATRQFISRKLLLFVIALLVPEYILAWAIRQRLVAAKIAKHHPGMWLV